MVTYSVMYGGCTTKEEIPQGTTNIENFIKFFKSFPWDQEVEKTIATPHCLSPTVTLKNEQDETELLFSGTGQDSFVIMLVRKGLKKTWFGLGPEKPHSFCDGRQFDNSNMVEELCKLFFDRQYDVLKNKIN